MRWVVLALRQPHVLGIFVHVVPAHNPKINRSCCVTNWREVPVGVALDCKGHIVVGVVVRVRGNMHLLHDDDVNEKEAKRNDPVNGIFDIET